MKSQANIEIDRPIEHVFKVTTERVAEWSLVVVEDEAIEQTPEGVGTTFRCVTEERGKRMTFEGVVTVHEPPTRHAVEMVGECFDIHARYAFESLGDGTRTRVTTDSDVYGKGFFKVIFALCGWMMKKSSCEAGRKELESLKKLCESEP